MSYDTPEIDDKLKSKIDRLNVVISNLERNFSQGTSIFTDIGYKISYSKLNESQLKAVTTIDAKTLVIAGAGTGKTLTLTYRTSFLLENNVSPEKILILTFTKKAAGEITKRVNHLLQSELPNHITSGTFHSFCNMLLGKYSDLIGINKKFTILDQEDSRDLLDMLKKEFGLKKKDEYFPFPRKATLQTIISASRNRRIPIDEIIEKEHSNFRLYIPEILKIFKHYQKYKRINHLYDYDDLIDEVNNHLKSNRRFKEIIQEKYQYIMVDEYQDTNLPQKEFIDLLAERKSCSLMVVGDDNQSIYAFRGANYENILLFGETYKDAKLIKLEQNYRSTPNILEFINGVSDKISLGYRKNLFSDKEIKGAKPQFIRCTSQEHEAKFIADKIIHAKDRLDYKKMAVLCRSSFHSNFVQAEFLKRKIPFVVVGGIKFIEKRHIKDILAYMKILWNPLDTISWHRVLTILEGIGDVTATKITEQIQREDGRLAPLKNRNYMRRSPDLMLLHDALTSASKALMTTKDIPPLLDAFDIIAKYYIPVLKKVEDDWGIRVEDLNVIRRLCVEYKDIETFLSNLALDPPNSSNAIFTSAEPEEDSVTVSTIHSAKGLEWNTVFVICLIDGAVPHYKSFEDYEQLEEERKLFYVACSRAKENLYLTAPDYFTTYAAFFDRMTRFIHEVDEAKYDYNRLPPQ